jgi:Domain of unknown function (DUF4386)
MSSRTLARIAGSLYLLASLLFVFAIYVRSTVKAGGPAQIAEHLRSSAGWFRLGISSDLLSAVIFLAMAMTLYALLAHVDRLAAAAMVVFVAMLVTVGFLNDANQLTALAVATSPAYTNAFGVDGADALVTCSFLSLSSGLAVSELLWGVWLVPLSYLVIRSGQFPRLIGILLCVAAISWGAQFIADVATSGIPSVRAASQVGGLGEIVFVAWLIVFGIRAPVPRVVSSAA